jgi:integrase
MEDKRMGRVYKPHRIVAGKHIRYEDWYCEWHGADGRTKRKKIGPDKRLANEALARFEERERRRRLGLADSADDQAAGLARPVAELIREYLAILEGRDTSADYRALVDDYLTRLATDLAWFTFADLQADTLVVYLGQRREVNKNGPATLNSYLRIAKGFARWYAARIGLSSPLDGIDRFEEEVDRRRSRRILTDAELAKLLESAARCPRRGKYGIWGPERVMLYLVAAFTGIRAGELAELTPLAFQLDANPPTVTVEAKDAKGKRAEPIPLPDHVVERLRPWLAQKHPGARLWPGYWARQRKQIHWLERDLKRAGVAERDERGRRVTFHSLKRRFVISLIQAGGKIHEIRRMARHRDVRTTLNYYVDENLSDLGALANRLPALG